MSYQQSSNPKDDPFADFTSFQEFGKSTNAGPKWTGFRGTQPGEKEFEEFDFKTSKQWVLMFWNCWVIIDSWAVRAIWGCMELLKGDLVVLKRGDSSNQIYDRNIE